MSDRPLLGVVVALTVSAVACAGGGGASTTADNATASAEAPAAPTTPADPDAPPGDGATGSAPSTTAAGSTPTPASVSPPLTRPDWLGTRVLTTVPGEPPLPTPPELDPRHLPTTDVLPPPADGAFRATVQAVAPEVAARSTWQGSCPVTLDELRYVTVSFWGFDDRPHTGEMLVHRDAAEPLTQVFAHLFDARFPIEDMHVTTAAERDAPNTGDGNATAAFVCRPTRGGTRWSQHAFGLAIDVNPFQNPYVRDGGVIPGLAESYVDRADVRPGMLLPGAGVIEAFAAAGWQWGGTWSDPVDTMHFSANGR